jgi:glycosyltransferase involved in cell wall biosynthesis
MGDGSLAPQVHRFIRGNGLSQFVHLTGQVPHEQLVDYFNMADVYVSSAYSDGTSISLLEAMACARPVVMTDIPGNREWVDPCVNGWLFKPGDASSLASVLLQALDDTSRWAQMGQANVAIARERADWNKNFQVLLGAYERLGPTA